MLATVVQTQQLEEQLAVMVTAEELEEVVKMQRAALFDITAKTFSAENVPFKRESTFQLDRPQLSVANTRCVTAQF